MIIPLPPPSTSHNLLSDLYTSPTSQFEKSLKTHGTSLTPDLSTPLGPTVFYGNVKKNNDNLHDAKVVIFQYVR